MKKCVMQAKDDIFIEISGTIVKVIEKNHFFQGKVIEDDGEVKYASIESSQTEEVYYPVPVELVEVIS